MTAATIEMTKADDVSDIDVDIDDNGYAFVKQQFWEDTERQEWICLPLAKVPELIAALQQIRVE